MDKLDLIGKTVVRNTGEEFTIISANFSDRVKIVLDDGKLGYDLRTVLKKGTLRFKDENFQELLKRKFNELDEKKAKENEKPTRDVDDYILSEAARLFKCVGPKQNIYYTYSSNFSCLKYGVIYGKKALDIYNSCCKSLGFYSSLKGNFNLQKILFANSATPEGYAVWMLPHNNLTGDAKCWANII